MQGFIGVGCRKGCASILTLAASLCAFGSAAIASDVAALPGSKAVLPARPANGEMGFVLTDFSFAIHPGNDSCPDGRSSDLRQIFLSTLPAKESARLARPENEKELLERRNAYAFGPNNTNICTAYDQFPGHPFLRETVQSKVAYGLDLDGDAEGGSANPNTCPHEAFTSPANEQGIDNQSYRVLGCWGVWRAPDGSAGSVAEYAQQRVRTQPTVMLLRGVDDLRKDDDVEVIVASTPNVPVQDVQGKILPDISFTVSENPRWRNVLRGRIVDGVLTTSPGKIVLTRALSVGGAEGNKAEWQFHDARLRLALKPDGSLEGILGAYLPPKDLIGDFILAGRAAAISGNVDCASQYNTLKKYADGGRDPKTGQCSVISSALRVTAVPAFVFDTPPEAIRSASTTK